MRYLTLIFLIPAMLFSQIPQTLHYQGKLLDDNNDPVTDSTYSVAFSIYDASTGGNVLWNETRSVSTSEGFFNVTLGENTPIDISEEQDLWLNINIDNNDLTPRTKLSPGLSSMNTKQVENTATAGNSVVDAVNSSSGGVNASKIADGSVSDSEFQHLSNVNTDIQNQIDSKQDELPSQSGNSGKFLTTDGSSLSWGDASGGGGGTNVLNASATSSLYIDDNNYETQQGMSFNLDANSTYIVKGRFKVARYGSDEGLDIKLNYSGDYEFIQFSSLGDFRSFTEESLNINFGGVGTFNDMVIDGLFVTNTSGNLTLDFRQNINASDDMEVNSDTVLYLIKVE